MEASIREGLLKAAAHIETFGLNKGDNYADYGNAQTSSACIMGAIGLFILNMDDSNQAIRDVRKIIGTEWVATWNDRSETTKEMVVYVLRKAADLNKAEREES